MPRPRKPSDLPPIYQVHGQRVILDRDLARIYGVTTAAFNQAVRRNRRRFPAEFVFEIGAREFRTLISQIVISKGGSKNQHTEKRGGRQKPVLLFTEHGAIMAATILRSPRAIAMSVYVVRAFVRMREQLLTRADILRRLAVIDKKLLEHDVVLRDIVGHLVPLLKEPAPAGRPKIGFHQGNR